LRRDAATRVESAQPRRYMRRGATNPKGPLRPASPA
jgi:hypothetical protein